MLAREKVVATVDGSGKQLSFKPMIKKQKKSHRSIFVSCFSLIHFDRVAKIIRLTMTTLWLETNDLTQVIMTLKLLTN